MSGLMTKDLKLLVQRKQTIVLFILIAILMSVSTEGTFIVGYLTFLMVVYATSTISYDEYDNGMPFLMSLPIARKTYVMEKYLFCILSGLVSWVVAVILFGTISVIRNVALVIPDAILESVMYIPVFLVLIAFMIPFLLKYGMEKGRIVLVVFGGSIFAISILIKKFTELHAIEMPNLIARLEQKSDGVLLVASAVVSLVILMISVWCSCRIMEKKEF